MRDSVVKNNLVFYLLCFAVWAQVIIVIHGNYPYCGKPIASDLNTMNLAIEGEFNRQKSILNTLHELYLSLVQKEQTTKERGHIYHNIGTSYFDLLRVSSQNGLMDSVEQYYLKSISELPDIPRFHYNIGRFYTEFHNHTAAKDCYEKAIAVKPDHIPAMHNLALLNYFELGDVTTAKTLLKRILGIQPWSPVCNYVLGEIFEAENNFDKAIFHYNKELETINRFLIKPSAIPIARSTLLLARLKSHQRLALLYAGYRRNYEQAQKNIDAYLSLEHDENEAGKTLRLFSAFLPVGSACRKKRL